MIELIICYNSIKSQSMFFDRLLLSNLHIHLKLVNVICDIYTHTAVKWLKYCQYGVIHYPINQSMSPVQREQNIIMKTLLKGQYIKLFFIYQAFSKSIHWNNLFSNCSSIDWLDRVLTVQLPRDLTLQMGNALMAFKLDGQAL